MIIGLDVGGTHTDVVLLGEEGLIREIKIPTDHSDLFSTVLESLNQITSGLGSKRIRRIVLSTTLTTNSIAQKKIPKVGMIVSAGPGIDPFLFQTNEYYVPVSGSIDHRGREVEPVRPEEIKKAARNFLDNDISHVGVVSKFSIRNPAHELKISEVLKNSFEKVFLGHRISGNLNFPRRIATTFLNASVYPIHKKFFNAVKRSLKKKGLEVPIHILKADGGTMSIESSIDSPGQTILSGPAASVMGSIAFAPDNQDALVMDIGGTTTDMAALINQIPVLEPVGINIGGYRTLIRALEVHSIALGGDSAITITNGILTIGPERKGPAMAYGGPVPTPTDALVVLGKIENSDREKAVSGIKALAESMGNSLEDTAQLIFDSVCKKILAEANAMIDRINSKPVYTIHELQEGYKLNPKDLLIIGGPAPYFADQLEKMSDYNVHVVPRWGVANAIGAALARTTSEVTLFADTEQGIATAHEENFSKKVDHDYSGRMAVENAYKLLRKKALRMGANSGDLELEVLENQQFNMVRGFLTTGKNIRVKVQVKPGLIHEYDSVVNKLTR